MSSPAFAQEEKESGFGFGSEFDDKLDMAQSAKTGENKFGLKDRLKLFSQNLPGLGRGSRPSPYVPSYTSNPPVQMPNANRRATSPIKPPGSATDLPIGEGGAVGAGDAAGNPVGSSGNADGSIPGATVPVAGSQGSRNSLAPDATGVSSPTGQGQTQGAGDVALRGPMGDSMTISQAMNETLINSPRASAVRFNLGVTRAQLIRATELPNPTIFMDSGYKAEFTYRYGATLPIEPPWKLVFRVLAAKKQIKQTDFEIRNALWQLRGDIRRAYTELVVAQETLETLTELYELSARLTSVAEKRFQAGDVPELDVLKARLLNGQNAIERDVGGRRVIQARQALAILLGRGAQTDVQVPRLSPFKLRAEAIDLLPDFNKDLPQLDVLMAAAKENRLELKVLAQSIKTGQANLRVAYGNVIPNPIVGAGS
ncbi:MAG: TolC family protein, partial [Leptolyngbya sp.]|nr:TolC family protein [Candidatus Melainabacteria bacterium]